MSAGQGKLQGGAGMHGTEYQIKLYMLFLLKGYTRNHDFFLSAEDKRAGKFDDLVYQENEETLLLQAKHKDNPMKKIMCDQIFANKGEFSLPKYLQSFVEVKSNFSNKTTYIICSNINVSNDITTKFTIKRNMSKDHIFYNSYTDSEQFYYSLNTAETLNELKLKGNNICLEDICDFLQKLQLIVVKDNDIEQIIKEILQSLLAFDPCVTTKSVYDFIFNKLKIWFGKKKFSYLTNLHLKSYFSEILSSQFIQGLKEHDNKIIFPDIELPEARVITIATSRYYLLMLKLFNQLQKLSNETLLFVDPDNAVYQENMIESFVVPHFTHLVCRITSDNNKVIKTLENVLEKTKEQIFKIVIILTDYFFPLKCSQAVQEISDVEFYNNIKLSENVRNKCIEKNEDFYITRKLIENNYKTNEYTEHEFLKKALNSDETFLISEIAGMGKSMLLSNLLDTINKNYANFWAIKINLNNYTNIFKTCFQENKFILLEDILGTNPQIQLFEKEILTIPKLVVLLVDGLDEIFSDYLDLVLLFLNKLRNSSNIKTLIVTSRPHINSKIEEKLPTKIFHLIPLTRKEQCSFLAEYWINNLYINDEDQKERFRKYGPLLLINISSMVSRLESLIGIPLIVKILSGIFQGAAGKNGCNQFLENAEENVVSMSKWNISKLYDKFIEIKKQIYIEEKSQAKGNKIVMIASQNEFDICLKECECWALNTIFPPELSMELQSKYFNNISIERLCNTGLITSNNENCEFLHRTFAEHLVSKHFYHHIINGDFEHVICWVENVLCNWKYHGTHRFINAVLEKEWTNLKPFVPKIFGEEVFQSLFRNNKISLNHLAEHNYLYILKLLLDECEASDEIINSLHTTFDLNLRSLLHSAIYGKAENVVKYLVELGTDVNLPNSKQETGLHISAELGYLNIVQYLLEKGADKNIRSVGGHLALHLAVSNNQIEVTKFLIDNESDINDRNNSGKTPLYMAAERKSINMVDKQDGCVFRYLITRGANINIPTNTGLTVLHCVLQNENIIKAKYLISKGANINAKSIDGVTPLYLAACKNQLEIVRLLITKGANLGEITIDGYTALHGAAFAGTYSIVKYLLEKGADIAGKTDQGMSVLYLAVFEQNSDMIGFLINKGADVNSRTNNGDTALHVAVDKEYCNIVEILVDKGANITHERNDGVTPLQIAKSKQNSTLLEILSNKLTKRDNINRFQLSEYHKATKIVNKLNFGLEACLPPKEIDLPIFSVENTHIREIAIKHHLTVHKAAYEGNITAVRYHVGTGIDVNCQLPDGYSLLHSAVQGGNVNLVKYLVHIGADRNARTNTGFSILHSAVFGGNLEVVNFLFEKGVNIFEDTNDGRTVLHFAVYTGNIELLDYLIRKGADPNIKSYHNETVLHFAAYLGYVDVVDYLIKMGANLKEITEDGKTILHSAIYSQKFEMITYLVEKDCDVLAKTSKEQTFLHIAAYKGDIKIVEYLIKRGADVYAKTSDGYSVFHFAIHGGNFETFKFLLEVCKSWYETVGHTILYTAAYTGNVKIIQYLINKGIDVGVTSTNGQSVLHFAAYGGNITVLKFLIEIGINIDARTITGQSVLHFAALGGHIEIIQYLVEQGIQLGLLTNNQESVIHFAALSGNIDVIMYLLEKKVNPFYFTIDGHTVLHLAAYRGNIDIINYFLLKDFDINLKDFNKRSVLHYAAYGGNIEMAKHLIEKGIDFHAIAVDGETVLHAAAYGGSLELVKYLLSLNLDLATKDNNGNTPLHSAASTGSINVVKFLYEEEYKLNTDINFQSLLQSAAYGGSTETMNYIIGKVDKSFTLTEENSIIQAGIFGGNATMVKYLLDEWTTNNVFELGSVQIMHSAAYGGNISIMKYLLSKGLFLSIKTLENQSLLHSAAYGGNIEIVKYLIDHGADVDETTDEGQSVIHAAAYGGNISLLQYLCEKGANLRDLTSNGQSILHFAVRGKHLHMVQFLVELGANINYHSYEKESILQAAAYAGNIDIVRYLIIKGAGIEFKDKKKRSLLCYAIDGKNTEVIDYLKNMKGAGHRQRCKSCRKFITCLAVVLVVLVFLIHLISTYNIAHRYSSN